MGFPLDIPMEPTTGLQQFAIAINFFFPALALLVVTARVVGRLSLHQFGLDDWFISIGMFLSLIEAGISYIFMKANFIGIHFDQIPPHNVQTSLFWNYLVESLYNPTLAMAKASVLVFLLRLFGQKNGTRRFIIGLNAMNLMLMVGILVAVIFQCTPIAFSWDRSIPGGHCIDQRLLFVSTSALNIVTDLIVLGLPLYILADLQIRRRTKIGLIFIFLLGILVTITSVARMVIFVQGFYGLVTSDDPTFNIGFVTSVIETNLALITASIPALRPFLRSRDRGGWLPRFGRSGPDTEMVRHTDYMSRASTMTTAKRPGTATSVATMGRQGRGQVQSKIKGSKSSKSRSRRDAKRPPALRDIRIRELRSQSPRRSQEEAMTSNGIVRVSDIQREIDGLARELTAVSGTYAGPYTGGYAGPYAGSYAGFLDTDPEAKAAKTRPRTAAPTPTSATTPTTATATVAPPPPPPPPPPPNRARFAGRYEDADPDTKDRAERDFNEERLSRYGERRFGVVTPKGAPPQWPGSRDGEPF